MTKIAVPTALFVGEKDDMGDCQDVATLIGKIGQNPACVFNKVYKDFSHVTYFLGTPGAFQTWYPDL